MTYSLSTVVNNFYEENFKNQYNYNYRFRIDNLKNETQSEEKEIGVFETQPEGNSTLLSQLQRYRFPSEASKEVE